MATLSDYMSGTISLANGSVTVTGTGTLFEVTRFGEGDTLQIQNLTAVIASVDSDTQLTLTEPWTGTTIVDGPYRARQLGDGSRVSTQAATIIELLGNGVLMNLAELGVEEGKVPVGGPTGEYELVDTSTFGVQDPNGTLGQLAALTSFPIAGLLNGFTIANEPTTPNSFISVSPGIAINDAGTISMSMPSGMRKGLNANWSGGSGVGGLDVGSVASSTWYHVFAIYNPTEKITDVLFSGSISNPQMPSGYSAKRRIGSIRTDASANIVRFLQTGDYFAYNTPINVISGAWDGGTTPKILPLTVPVGIKVEAVIGATYQTSGTAGQFVFVAMVDPDQGGVVTLNNSMLHVPQDDIMTTIFRVYTDVNGRVLRWANTTAENDVTVSAWVHGYTDRRGK